MEQRNNIKMIATPEEFWDYVEKQIKRAKKEEIIIVDETKIEGGNKYG